jgi:P-type Ca2+ transporter type 2C
MSDWYRSNIEETARELNSSPGEGLSMEAAKQRLEEHGPNELVERGVKSPWAILWDQFTETMVIVLVVAAAVSLLLGDLEDAVAILAIVVINALLGFRQEYQAERAMAALKKMAVPLVRVRRSGHVHEISAAELVPGDLVLLEAGNRVPADLRLVESANLRIQEAALTGESEPVSKEVQPLERENLPLGDRINMGYMGTDVSYGRGMGLVIATGMDTELGRVAELMQSAGQEKTPLQLRLNQLGKGLALVAFLLVGVVFGLGLARGDDWRLLFLTAISMAVAAIPEGLPAVVTIALALGARRMLKRNALIRKLPAVETLGSVTVICSDKTGTLTQNRMTVTVLDVAGSRIDMDEEMMRGTFFKKGVICEDEAASAEQLQLLQEKPALAWMLAGGALSNDALIECDDEEKQDFHIVGDPTEGALVVAADRVGLDKHDLEAVMPRKAEVPFDSERKRMSTIHKLPENGSSVPPALQGAWQANDWVEKANYAVFTKGAMDSLLEVSTHLWVEGKIVPIDGEWRERIESANRSLAESGMRVLGVAFRPLDEIPSTVEEKTIEKDLIFVGLTGMIDPARPEVKDAVATAKTAGIRPMMITGDHPLTARYIAQELGIAEDGAEVLTGAEVEKMSEEQLIEVVQRVQVYARVSPEHKLKIVQALQSLGEIAAMTGDGVNDAPALRKADIGVAMGITGTDVSKEASDMVLLDDNFATIVAAVSEGRVIYDNIRKFIKYTLSSNAGEIWVMLAAPFLGMPLPLLPLQILWINLVTDGLPGLALGVEKPERNTMQRPPYPPNENIFARGMARDILWVGALMAAVSLGVGYTYWLNDPEGVWRTMVFTTLTLSQMGFVLALRSSRYSFFQIGPFSNMALIGAVILTFLLQMGVVYLPFMQEIFDTQALPLRDLLISLGLATSLFIAVEIQKWIIRLRTPEQEG